MSSRRRARHLRRRGWPLRLAAVVVVVLGLASTAAAGRIVLDNRNRFVVPVLVGGVTHTAEVTVPASVGEVLEAAEVEPRDGQLLSLVTGTVLDDAHAPVQLLVDGIPATRDTPVLVGSTVGVVEPDDVVEEMVEGSDPIPAPPMPTVIHGLWHPGQPGLTATRKGAISGELVSAVEVQAAVPPTPVTEKLVALTFDDGPGPLTMEFLRVLREKDVKATFCVVSRLLRKEGLDTAKAVMGEGHHLCNHTINHDAGLPNKSQKAIDEEIRGANRQLVERTGVKPAYYRAPAGKMSSKIEATVKDEGQQVLLWTIDTKDFQKPAPEAIIGAVTANVKPGAVVLMHDGGGDRSTTLAALPAIIDHLRAAGYTFVLPDAVPPVAAAPLTPPTPPV